MQFGRNVLYTDVQEVTYENIIPVLQKAFQEHLVNSARIDYLLEYEAGKQPLVRKKINRPSIDVKCVDNVANEIATFHIGYKWGIPITIVQRGEKDSGASDEVNAIALLNEQYELQQIRKKTQRLARFVEICGIGYTFVDVNTEYEDGEAFFNIEALDPRNTFIVRSSYYYDNRPVMGVTYYRDTKGTTYFTCFTKDRRYEIVNPSRETKGIETSTGAWQHDLRSGELNPLGRIPIVEWIRSDDRMGCFERQIDDMNCLNLIESDICNATEEAVQSIWHCNDVEFPMEIVELPDGTKKEVPRKPKNNEWMQTFTSQDGKTPFVTPLSSNFNYQGNLEYALAKRLLILQKANVPSRNQNSGGSTGLGMNSAIGMDTAEAVATAQQNITEGCKMEELRLVLIAIKKSPFIDVGNPLMSLSIKDVQPNIKRNKAYEISTKANCFSTLVSHGINGYHALKVVNMFDDVNQVYADSRELIEKYQKSVFDKDVSNEAVGGEGEQKPNADRIMQDLSDQTQNSPAMNGVK